MSKNVLIVAPDGVEWMWVNHICPKCKSKYPRDGICAYSKCSKEKLVSIIPHYVTDGYMSKKNDFAGYCYPIQEEASSE
ncbi:MAG TPA: hypothetical protein VMX17_06010 [Candidatus Glassbacteria bacterium]|nr:hypothetical protein [Candidatus Glassbacteria bacterium]